MLRTVSGPSQAARSRWDIVVERVRACGDPLLSPALSELYALAMRDGLETLAGFGRLNEQEREDIVAEKIALRLTQIIEADHPRRFLLSIVKRAANSALRRKNTVDKYEADLAFVAEGTARTEDDTLTSLSLADRLMHLSSRDQQVVRAVHLGENREDVARRFGTSRANVDQIVSRVARMGRQP